MADSRGLCRKWGVPQVCPEQAEMEFGKHCKFLIIKSFRLSLATDEPRGRGFESHPLHRQVIQNWWLASIFSGDFSWQCN